MINRIVCLLSLLSLFAFEPVNAALSFPTNTQLKQQIEHLHSQANALDRHVLLLALRAFYHAREHGMDHKGLLSIIDYTKPSSQKRLWIFDLKTDRLAFKTLVAHGINSGEKFAKHFSNLINSHQSSVGVFLTESTYFGHYGYSLRLKGLDRGVNDNAETRHIVMHGADYVSQNYVNQFGEAGTTWGCPAINTALVRPIVNTIKNGTVLFVYYPVKQWLKTSRYLQV